jgi:hypothetical protein
LATSLGSLLADETLAFAMGAEGRIMVEEEFSPLRNLHRLDELSDEARTKVDAQKTRV